MSKPKILVFDLETLPDLAQVMRVFPGLSDYPGRTLKADINSIICFGYKWLGDKKISCINAWDYPKSWRASVNADKQLVIDAREVLESADGVVTHNGRKFDWKVFNTRLMKHGLVPLTPKPHVDTCAVSRAKLHLFSNSLNNVATHLSCTNKKEISSKWGLWERVLNREPAAQREMTAYCKQDVGTLEEVFFKLRPYAKDIPNYNLFTGVYKSISDCPTCGHNELVKHGTRLTRTGKIQRYQCNSCGSICSGRRADSLGKD